MTKVEKGSTHKRIPLYNGFFLKIKKNIMSIGGTWKEVLSKVYVCSMFLVFKKRRPKTSNSGEPMEYY